MQYLDFLLIVPGLDREDLEDLNSYETYLYNRVSQIWETITANPAFHPDVEQHAIVTDSKTNKVRLDFQKLLKLKFYIFRSDEADDCWMNLTER